MSILCRIGIHRWRVVGISSLVMPTDVEQCTRCECGRVRDWTATWHYTPEQMRAALATFAEGDSE